MNLCHTIAKVEVLKDYKGLLSGLELSKGLSIIARIYKPKKSKYIEFFKNGTRHLVVENSDFFKYEEILPYGKVADLNWQLSRATKSELRLIFGYDETWKEEETCSSSKNPLRQITGFYAAIAVVDVIEKEKLLKKPINTLYEYKENHLGLITQFDLNSTGSFIYDIDIYFWNINKSTQRAISIGNLLSIKSAVDMFCRWHLGKSEVFSSIS